MLPNCQDRRKVLKSGEGGSRNARLFEGDVLLLFLPKSGSNKFMVLTLLCLTFVSKLTHDLLFLFDQSGFIAVFSVGLCDLGI